MEEVEECDGGDVKGDARRKKKKEEPSLAPQKQKPRQASSPKGWLKIKKSKSTEAMGSRKKTAAKTMPKKSSQQMKPKVSKTPKAKARAKAKEEESSPPPAAAPSEPSRYSTCVDPPTKPYLSTEKYFCLRFGVAWATISALLRMPNHPAVASLRARLCRASRR